MKIPLLLGVSLALPGTALAQLAGFSWGMSPDYKQAAPSDRAVLLTPFKYLAPAGDKASGRAIKRPPSQQKIADLNAAGDYQAIADQGPAVVASEKTDDGLQLMVANSLAWTGRAREAMPAYAALTHGEYADQAFLGIANIDRWQGRDDLALPLYQALLDKDPSNGDALEGAAMAAKELAPRTTVGAFGSTDSGNMQRRSGVINHRWRDGSGAQIFELETSAVRDWLPPPAPQATQPELLARYQHLAMDLKPSLELELPARFNRQLFATGRVKLFDDRASIGAGIVNWGRKATSPNALMAGLTANYLGADATGSFDLGSLTGRFDYYDISDSNTILTHSVNFNSAWRPFGSHFKPFFGLEGRKAKVSTSSYWSPVLGSGTAYAGLMGEWGESDWNLFASVQWGARLYGDAGTSWSASTGGKRWLSSDIAVSANLWSMASWRDNAAYRAQSLNVNLEKLWR